MPINLIDIESYRDKSTKFWLQFSILFCFDFFLKKGKHIKCITCIFLQFLQLYKLNYFKFFNI